MFDFVNLKKQMLIKGKSINDVFSLANGLEENSVFITGGVVRDFVSGKEKIKGDMDLFVSDRAYSLLNNLQSSYGVRTRNQFGSDRWFPEDNSFYFDIIRISDFYQGLWKCVDIIDVLNQFDITANAMAFDLKNGRFFNPVNGLRDAKNSSLRAVRFDFPEILVSSEIPISRNSVLWFRYNHYSKKLDYEIEPVTHQWIQKNRYRIDDIEIFRKNFFDPEF